MSKTCDRQCGCDNPTAPDQTATSASHGQAAGASGEWASRYTIPKMDCPSEERLIRMALADFKGIGALFFDLSGRKLEVLHDGSAAPITDKLVTLGLGASLEQTREADQSVLNAASRQPSEAEESSTLWILLVINAVMFVVEMTAGLIAQSAGLIADSLDMFADAAVYGLALYAVGHSIKRQVRAAHVAGVLQMILALGVLAEVIRRFVVGSEPQSTAMMTIAFVALIANSICLLLIHKHRHGGAHMKASWIFSANDVVINLGVITAGALVAWTGSHYPDLVIGTFVGVIVLLGARRILALKS